MLKKISSNNVLFLDIETVPQEEDWDNLSKPLQELFSKKTAYRREKEDIPVAVFYEQNAGIWAEFGKIICISCGFIYEENKFKVKSFFGDDEPEILNQFSSLLEKHYNKKQSLLCAHNGKEFDFPYMARRMIINQLEIPQKLNLFGKKPWEVPHLDTLDLWKFGDYKHYTSLNLLATILGIPTPKDDIDGSQVRDVYYKEKNIERIKEYCEKDVITVAQIFRKLRLEPSLEIEK